MFLKTIKLAFAAYLLLTLSSAFAADTITYTDPTYTPHYDSQRYVYPYHNTPWKIEVAPYIWALNMNGTVAMRRTRAHVDETFSDILSQLNWAGMVWLDATNDKFGVFANALLASLSNSASDRYISANVDTKFALYSAGISYQVYKKCFNTATCNATNFSIEPYLGARLTMNDASLTVNTPLGNLVARNNQHWTDPIIGARFRLNMNQSWLAIAAGDIGGTNASSDYSYNVYGLLGFKPQTFWKTTTWYLGYRILDEHYVTGRTTDYFNWNMKIFGPLAGVSFTF